MRSVHGHKAKAKLRRCATNSADQRTAFAVWFGGARLGFVWLAQIKGVMGGEFVGYVIGRNGWHHWQGGGQPMAQTTGAPATDDDLAAYGGSPY